MSESESRIEGGKVEIYQKKAGEVVFDVDLTAETIWATQAQLAELFEIDKTVVGRHLKNIYESGELEEVSTSAKNAVVRIEGGRQVRREVKKYNLDAIISVGYRVNSRKATDFRIWATQVLKKYLVGGVAVNQRRLAELTGERMKEVERLMDLVKRVMQQQQLSAGEATGALEVIARYAGSFKILKEYAEGEVRFGKSGRVRKKLEIEEILKLISELRLNLDEALGFGEIRDESEFLNLAKLQEEPGSVTEKAAELLYRIIKKRPFEDGNKRIGALIFVAFLTFNDCQLTSEGETKISDQALVALTLLIAESDIREEKLIKALICKLLEK